MHAVAFDLSPRVFGSSICRILTVAPGVRNAPRSLGGYQLVARKESRHAGRLRLHSELRTFMAGRSNLTDAHFSGRFAECLVVEVGRTPGSPVSARERVARCERCREVQEERRSVAGQEQLDGQVVGPRRTTAH